MAIVAKRTIMHLYSDRQCPYSHQVRIVLAEKGVNVEIQHVDANEIPEDLHDINPYSSTPTLVDRELILYQANIIMEYLDERLPHPPLLPVYPVARAEFRKMMYRIEHDWYSLVRIIENGSEAAAAAARLQLQESMLSLEPVFADKPYFLNEDFSLLDCCLAPLMWRFHVYGIEIPPQAQGLIDYMKRVFERASFQASLTDVERELRAA